MAAKILVTGASGHVGNVQVRRMLELGQRPRVLIEPGDDAPALEGLDVERVAGDVRDAEAVQRAVDGCELVFHVAGLVSITAGFESLMMDVNVGGTANVVEACKKAGVRRLVYTSSIHAFTEVPSGTTMDESAGFDPAKAYGPYGRSKAAASRLVQDAARTGALDAVIVNPVGVTGPLDFRLSEIGDLVVHVGQKKRPVIVTGGYHWVDVRDVAEGTLAAAERGRSGEAYLLTAGYMSAKQLCSVVADAAGVKPPPVVLPLVIAQAVSWPMLAWERVSGRRALMTPYALHTLACGFDVTSAKAKAELGFSPRPIDASLRDAWQWMKTDPRSALNKRAVVGAGRSQKS